MLWLVGLAPLTAAIVLATACGESGESPGANAGAGAVAPTAADAAAPVDDAFARTLATSPAHACALREAGVFCWGANARGQLGTEAGADSALPVKAAADAQDVVEIAAQAGHTCIRKRDGEVACWGANERGQFGDGTRDDSFLPVTVPEIDDAQQLALAEGSTCVLRADSNVWCWGNSPETAPGEGSLMPTAIAGLSGVVEIQASSAGTYCARGQEGWVQCWLPESGSWTTPVEAHALAGAQAIAVATREEVCGIMATGEIVCHDLTNSFSVPLADSEGSVAIVGGLYLVCATGGADSWYCWNILPPMLEAVGSPRRDLQSAVPLLELSTAGFRYCGLRQDQQVVCMESNTTSPGFALVSELPD